MGDFFKAPKAKHGIETPMGIMLDQRPHGPMIGIRGLAGSMGSNRFNAYGPRTPIPADSAHGRKSISKSLDLNSFFGMGQLHRVLISKPLFKCFAKTSLLTH